MNRKILATAIGIALLAATPALAGGWCDDGSRNCRQPGPPGNGYYGQGYGYGHYAPQPYGRRPNGSYGYLNGGHGYVSPYQYLNGGHGHDYAPPPPRKLVPLEPMYCSPHDMIFIPRFNRHACRPVMVRPE